VILFPRLRGLANFLTESRAAFLPIIIAPLVLIPQLLSGWLSVALIIGSYQSIAIARWLSRRSFDWNPALRGGLALGRSAAAIQAKRAAGRGAIAATLGAVCLEVILLEASLALFGLPVKGGIGTLLIQGDWDAAVGGLVLISLLSCGFEFLSGVLLQPKKAT
ncbi:MAG: hypothetical protein MK135_17945, partial [Polyangiaceae bacterium]|nr:hypothetical protein [Polyangiaceae bacterium]